MYIRNLNISCKFQANQMMTQIIQTMFHLSFRLLSNTKSVQQKKLERYDIAAKRKIRFPSPVKENKRLKLTKQATPEKLYTATPCSPFKPFVNNAENTRATSPLSPIMSLNHWFVNTPSTGIKKNSNVI